jgi:hypothetical protein
VPGGEGPALPPAVDAAERLDGIVVPGGPGVGDVVVDGVGVSPIQNTVAVTECVG